MKKMVLILFVCFVFQSIFGEEVPSKEPDNSSKKIEIKEGFWGDEYIYEGKTVPVDFFGGYNFSEILAGYKDEEILSLYSSARTLSGAGSILSFAGACAVGFQLGGAAGGGEINPVILGVGGGVMVTGIIFSAIGSSKFKQTVDLYNTKVAGEKGISISLAPSLSLSGSGLMLSLEW